MLLLLLLLLLLSPSLSPRSGVLLPPSLPLKLQPLLWVREEWGAPPSVFGGVDRTAVGGRKAPKGGG